MKEEWVEVENYPNYAVSNLGRVVNISRDAVLKSRPNDEGYLRVSLSSGGRVKDFYVHRLVAGAFHAGYDHREQIIHWDDNHSNNKLSNLRMRKRPRGERPLRRSRRQTGRQVEVVETGEVFRTARDCANHIGGDYGSVYACLRGDRKTHMGYTFKYYDW